MFFKKTITNTNALDHKKLPKYLFLLLVALIVLHKFYFVAGKALPDIQQFIKAKANYSRLRSAYPTFATSAEAKKILPAGTMVGIPRLSPDGENIAARYSLYPLKISKNSDYLIDFTRSVTSPALYKTKKQLSTGVFIYGKNDFPALPDPKMITETSPVRLLAQFLLMAIFEAGLGLLVLQLIKIPINRANVIWAAATGYLVGFCVFTAILWAALLLGFSLGAAMLLLIGLFITGALLIFSLKQKFRFESAAPIQGPKDKAANLFKILLIAYIAMITLWAISSPVKDWDTMSNWIIKSKVIYHERSLDLQYTNQNHNEYPILWPLHIAAQFTLFDTDHDEIAVWNAALLFLILIVQLFQGVSLTKGKSLFTYAVIIVFITFFVSPNPAILALPENVFCALLAAAMLSIVLWLRSPTQTCYLALSIFLALGLCLVKLEGFIAILTIIFALIAADRGVALAPKIRPYLLVLLFSTFLPVLWAVWIRQQGFLGNAAHFQNGITTNKLFLLGVLNINHFVRHGEYLIFLYGFIYFIFSPNHRKWHVSEKFLLNVTILTMLFKWTATIGWTEEMMMSLGIFPDAAWRLFLHAGPGLLFLFSSRASQRL